MNMKPENLTRALAILTTEVDETDVCFQAGCVVVRGQILCPQLDDDCEVLAILMANPEFGFAVSTIENLAKDLRGLQEVWSDAARKLKLHEARIQEDRRWKAAA